MRLSTPVAFVCPSASLPVVGYVRAVTPTALCLTTRDGEEVWCHMGTHLGWDVLEFCRERFVNKYAALGDGLLVPLDPDTGRPGTPYDLLSHTFHIRPSATERPGR